jgi:phosphoribosylpyrophosphate synthetase
MLTQTRYFPYSRQSKKKSHRGSITARMLANLLTVAGVDHVITLDLHVRVEQCSIRLAGLSIIFGSTDTFINMFD